MPAPKQLDVNKIIHQYNEGVGVQELSTCYSVHRSTIQRLLIKHKVKFHSRVPVYKYNFSFFNNYTPESCYWAGFIMADGYIRSASYANNLSIKLSIRDYDHLEKFKTIIGYTGDVKYSKTKSYCYIDLAGDILIRTLCNNFNITPRKSLTALFPNSIPYYLRNHFIRGYFDGDGTVFISNNRLSSAFIGTYDMLTNIENYFISRGVVARTKNGKFKFNHKSIKNTYSYSYGMKNTKTILHIMYENSMHLCRLDRKYRFSMQLLDTQS